MKTTAIILLALLGQTLALVMTPSKSFKSGIPNLPPKDASITSVGAMAYRYSSPPSVYLAVTHDDSVAVVDAKSGKLLDTLTGYDAPTGLSLNETLGLLFVVSSSTGTVSAVQLSSPRSPPVWSISLPGCTAVKQYGDFLWLSANNGLNVVDAKTGVASGSPVVVGTQEPYVDFTVSDVSNAVYISGGYAKYGTAVYLADQKSRSPLHIFPFPVTVNGIAAQTLDSKNNRLYVSARGTDMANRNKAQGQRLLPATPTAKPTKTPTRAPSKKPSKAPTRKPTKSPSRAPSRRPTKAPSRAPSKRPTKAPSRSPTRIPTAVPSASPTLIPTLLPTRYPTSFPTSAPSPSPTVSPSQAPTNSKAYDPGFLVVDVADGTVIFSYPGMASNCNGIYRDDDPKLYPYHAYIYVVCGGSPSTPGALYTFSAISPGGWALLPGKYSEKYALVDKQPLPSMSSGGLFVKSTRTLYIGVPALAAGGNVRTAQKAGVLAYSRKAGNGTPPLVEVCTGYYSGISKGGAVGVTFIITACVVGIATWIGANQGLAPAVGGGEKKSNSKAVVKAVEGDGFE